MHVKSSIDLQPVIIQIPRPAIENCYCLGVMEILDSFIPHLIDHNRNRMEFEVLGYEEDPREIYEIPEVRQFFQRFFQIYPGLFFWLNTRSHMMLLMAIYVFKPIRVDNNTTISNTDFQKFLKEGFIGLNLFSKKYGLDPDPTNKAIKQWMIER